MEKALTFNAVEFATITRNNQPWIRSPQIGEALGYGRKRGNQFDYSLAHIAICNLYARHADEFTDEMTAVVKLPTEGGEQDVRIFSLRGCHLLAMFARTPVAKAFRKWVLDVLDRLDRERETADAPLTPDQQCTLQAIIRAKIEALPGDKRKNRGLFPKAWGMFNNHFRLAQYRQLPQSRLSEAIAYLTQMDLTPVTAKALPASTCQHAASIQQLMDAVMGIRSHARYVCAPQSHPGYDREAADREELQEQISRIIDASLCMAENALTAAKKLRVA